MALNASYAKSVEGILKFLEIIATCIAFSCLADFKSDVPLLDKNQQRADFFLSVFIIGWVVVLFVFVVFLFSFEDKIMVEKNWNILLLLFSALFALLFLIASGLIADILNDLYDAQWNKVSVLKKYSDVLTVCVFFGFFSAVLLLVDAFLAFKKVRG